MLEPNINKKNSYLTDSQSQLVETVQVTSILPLTLVQHLSNWEYYYEGIADTADSVMFGHAVRPDRNLHPSAYNYYLDFAYNFGLLAVMPLLWLIFYTVKQVGQYATKNSHFDKNNVLLLFALSGIVLYLLFVDNVFRVSLRQPYSGIFTYFLWGLLISKLSYFNKKAPHVI